MNEMMRGLVLLYSSLVFSNKFPLTPLHLLYWSIPLPFPPPQGCVTSLIIRMRGITLTPAPTCSYPCSWTHFAQHSRSLPASSSSLPPPSHPPSPSHSLLLLRLLHPLLLFLPPPYSQDFLNPLSSNSSPFLYSPDHHIFTPSRTGSPAEFLNILMFLLRFLHFSSRSSSSFCFRILLFSSVLLSSSVLLFLLLNSPVSPVSSLGFHCFFYGYSCSFSKSFVSPPGPSVIFQVLMFCRLKRADEGMG